MSSTIKLSALKPGSEALIRTLPDDELCSSRLMDLGFYPGAKVRRLFSAVLGDPCAFSVQSAVIALRKTETERIFISPL